MTLKLYYDLLSQPSRALYILMKLSKIPFEPCKVHLLRGDHLREEFKKNISKFGKVPVLHDGAFRLTESVAIVRYLSRMNKLDEKWYPTDVKEQAVVDEYLEWQHLNSRAFCALYTRVTFLVPMITGKQPPEEKVKKYEYKMNNCLDELQELFLKPGPFICGSNATVADLFAACEIEQPRFMGFDPTVNRPVLAAWLKRVREEFNPVYAEAHEHVNETGAKQYMMARAKANL